MSKLIKINGHTCRALRISYVGELGFELHIPLASCVPIFNKVVDAGRGFRTETCRIQGVGISFLRKRYVEHPEGKMIDGEYLKSGRIT
ncbi:hypothetical protein NQ318_011175 [Aromia moschata]|uniref:GCVT N-terminal domain-containing protein n=1 Tax=Aromia moschata TaxID=1265417 RepID=A0AAV8YJM1_9CUCU|nr:hypothetical protein NQ318_011175 [Aromia moschata]